MHHQNAKQIISLTILVGALLLAPLAQSQGPTPPPTPPPPHRGLRYGIDQQGILPLLPGAQPQARTADQANAPACAPWSRLTFASYRNEHDWNVYVANGDGTGQACLTYYDKTDSAPKFNRGCTRLVYHSVRGRDYEVYVMNADGSGQTNISNHSANDGVPCWSPDSARIAFQTDRDDNSEVYVMNADGSSQTNLTNHPAYDGMPAWSADGKIAFVSNRTGQYEIWVMNPDGTGQTQVTHGVQWAEYPCWSPDGSRIAFSNDDNGDGFLDIDVVNADGTGLTFLAGHTNNVDYWYPAWSPDGEWIAYGRTELIYYQGNWYWTRTDIYAKGAPEYGYAQTALVASGRDWRPHWGTLDTQPPTSRIQGLPTYLGVLDTVSWSGQDVGPAGVASYDVQYRDGDNGTWTDWLLDARDSSACFWGEAGHDYYFRCRAQDRAGNQGTYPGTGPYPHTTFYTYRLSGRIRDIRDTPVTNAIVAISPPPLLPATTDSTSYYDAYLTGLGSHTVDVSKGNYGSLPPMSIQASQVLQPVTTYLPPIDEQVQNGGFEASPSMLSGWLSQGEIPPTVTNNFKHTGNYAALLASPFLLPFTPELNLSNTSGTSEFPQVEVDKNENVHVVWTERTLGYDDIYYIHRANNGTWSSPRNISNDSGYSNSSQLVVDGSGTVHIAWVDWTPGNPDIYYVRRVSDGTWSSPKNISNNAANSYAPQLAIDRRGLVHIVWHDETYASTAIHYAQRASDGTWSSPLNISGNVNRSTNPQLALDENNAIHVVWEGPDHSGVCYARRGSDGLWYSPRSISNECCPRGSQSPQLTVDSTGAVHVVWEGIGNSGIYYARRANDGIWSSPPTILDTWGEHAQLTVDRNNTVHVVWKGRGAGHDAIYYAQRGNGSSWSSPLNICHNSAWAEHPQLAVDERGDIHVVWMSVTGIYYARRDSNGAWSLDQNVSPPYAHLYGPQLAVGKGEFAHVVWYRMYTAEDVYYSRAAFVERTSDSSITQAFAITNTMHYPTLSFVYRIDGTGSSNGSWFETEVDDGIDLTKVLSTSVSTVGWAHEWINMSPWSGQIVTLTFNVHNEAGPLCTWAYLDEVSLGSAYPNLWVGKSSSTVPPGGGTVRYTIAYGNVGGVPAQTVRLTDTLPAGVAFVSASPAPTSTAPLIWDVGDLAAGEGPHAIVVTATVDAGVPAWTTLTNTVTIGADTPEADMDNNTAVAQTFVGYRTYLPLAARDW